MSTDTVGYTLTDTVDVFAVVETIDAAVVAIGGKKIKWDVCRGTEMFVMSFTVNNEARMLHIHFGIKGDYTEEPEPKVIYSLGLWGSSVKIITAVAEAMTSFGRSFVCEADTSEAFYEIPKVEQLA